MSLLEKVVTGKIEKPSMDGILGTSGVGKTSFAAGAPNPIFILTEEGTNQLDVARFPLAKSVKDVLNAIDELSTLKHDYKTLVIDSLDHLEILIWNEIMKENNVKDMGALPYGKGYALALEDWHQIFEKLKLLREKMNIIVICHSQIRTVNDPMQPAPYDRHEMKLNAKAAAFIKENLDSLLFATYELSVIQEKSGKSRAYGEGKRVLYTQSMPGHDAKNRYGLPYELPLSWDAFAEAKSIGQPSSPDKLKEDISRALLNVKDAELKNKVEKAVADSATDAVKLAKILNKLRVITNG